MASIRHSHMKYLFTAAVGPVRSFIMAARKTRDLYAGSMLLSEAAKAAARQFAAHDLIFPAANEAELNSPEFSAVNKILALVDTDDPAELARQVRRAALSRLHDSANQIEAHSVVFERPRMLDHIDGMLEFYAAWTPYSGPEQYGRERSRVEDLFNARKALNAFKAHSGVPARRKSSLDGGRETIILRRGKSPADLVRLRENEELDGPGLLKRFLKLPVRFESTTEAAALPYVRKLSA